MFFFYIVDILYFIFLLIIIIINILYLYILNIKIYNLFCTLLKNVQKVIDLFLLGIFIQTVVSLKEIDIYFATPF